MTAGPEFERFGAPTDPAGAESTGADPTTAGPAFAVSGDLEMQGAAVRGAAADDASRPAASGPAAPQPGAANPGAARESAAASSAPGEDRPHTGLDPVDRVLAREADVARLPVTERAAAYEELHAELEGILSEDPGKLPGALRGASSPNPGAAR